MSSSIQHFRERDHLQADLADVDSILASMGEHDDPIGCSQFIARRQELKEALRALGEVTESTGKLIPPFFVSR